MAQDPTFGQVSTWGGSDIYINLSGSFDKQTQTTYSLYVLYSSSNVTSNGNVIDRSNIYELVVTFCQRMLLIRLVSGLEAFSL